MSLPTSEVQVSINTCLEAVTQAFRDGGAIIEKIKKKRALKCAPQPPRLLEESIDQAPSEIERERRRGVARFGNAFEEGDTIAVIGLQQITIQLQQSLLEKLRNAAFDDDSRITDFTYLVDAADLGRDRTIATLHELKQRLLNAELALNESEAGVVTLQSSTPPVASPNAPSTPTLEPLPVRTRTNSSLTAPRTWTKPDYTQSRDASGEEDAVSGAEAENPRARQRKRSSLLQFLKHNRTHSGSERESLHAPVVQQPQIREESAAVPRQSQSIDKGIPTPRQSQSLDKGRQISSASPTQPPAYRPQPADPPFTYEEWEDNPQEIWGPATNSTASTAKPLERRDTAIPPDSQLPPSPVLTHRTNSSNGPHLSNTIPTPNPDNDYLGFCKTASRLQNSDRKALIKTREVEPWSRHPSSAATALHFLSCASKSCAFRSTFTHTDTDFIWNRLLPERKGVRARWKFLAKSHVPLTQRGKAVQASYKCLFCVFLGKTSGVFHGWELYLEHIANEHRGRVLGDVVLYKTGCVNERVCGEDELDWDINLYPVNANGNAWGSSVGAPGLSSSVEMPFDPDDYVHPSRWRMDADSQDSTFGANEPWNEGLSDFHYRGELDRTELE